MLRTCKVSQCCQCTWLSYSVHIMRQKSLQTTSICSYLGIKAHKVIKFGLGICQYVVDKILKVDEHSYNPCMSSWHVNVHNYETVDLFMRQFYCQTLTVTNSWHVNVHNYETVDLFMRQFYCQTLTVTNSS